MTKTLFKTIQELKEDNQIEEIKRILNDHDFHEIANAIDQMEADKHDIFILLPPEIQSEVVLFLSNTSKNDILNTMSYYSIARFLHFNDDDDATDIVQYLPEETQQNVLTKIKETKRKKIEKLLKYGKETAGGLMDLDYIIVKETFTFKDIAEKVQTHIDKEKKVPFIILTHENGKVIGFIPHKNLILSSPHKKATDLVQELPLIKHTLDQEKILEDIQEIKSDAIGVVDEHENLLGIIHVKDLLRIAQAEATEDVYSFAGVEKEEGPNDPILSKVKKRYKWLIINLGTAFLAASVVSMYQDTISKLSLLAVYMPIVAGEGGNAATQALAVVVRGLAMDEIPWSQARKIIVKEAIAGMINGVIVGVFAGLAAYMFNAPIMLGFVLGIAMITNLFIAGLFGALIPFILKHFKIDPATASSIFVTTATDIIGFFVFLSLGTLLLL